MIRNNNHRHGNTEQTTKAFKNEKRNYEKTLLGEKKFENEKEKK